MTGITHAIWAIIGAVIAAAVVAAAVVIILTILFPGWRHR